MTASDRERDSAELEPLDDELERTRRLILERRNRFMAAALAGLGMATGGCTNASVCLELPIQTSGNGGGGAAGSRPSVCLSPQVAPPPLGGNGGGGSGATGGARPTVCLSGQRAPEPCIPGVEGCAADDGGMEDGGEQA